MSLYSKLLLSGDIERWKSEGCNFKIGDRKNVYKNEEYEKQHHDNHNQGQEEHRKKDNCYDQYFDDIKEEADYENQYYRQNKNKQFNEYEQVTLNSYKQQWNHHRQKRNQRQDQRFNSRTYSNNGINNQNRNMNFKENYQSMNMTSQGYEKGNFYNSDRNFEEYNIDSRNLQYRFAEQEQEFNFKNEYRRYNDIQDDFRIERQKDYGYTNYKESYMNYEEPFFKNDYFEVKEFVDNRPEFKRIHDYDFVTPPIRFKDSFTNQHSLEDEKQSDYNVSPSVNEQQFETESEKSREKEEHITISNFNNTKILKEERTQEQLSSKNEKGRKLEEFRDATISKNAKHPIEMSHKDENPARNMTISSVTSVNQEILEEVQTLNKKSNNFVSIIQDYSEEKQLLIIYEDNETENVPDEFTIELKTDKLDTESNGKMTLINSATQQNLRIPGSMSFNLVQPKLKVVNKRKWVHKIQKERLNAKGHLKQKLNAF